MDQSVQVSFAVIAGRDAVARPVFGEGEESVEQLKRFVSE
jgi:hypothetical protein